MPPGRDRPADTEQSRAEQSNGPISSCSDDHLATLLPRNGGISNSMKRQFLDAEGPVDARINGSHKRRGVLCAKSLFHGHQRVVHRCRLHSSTVIHGRSVCRMQICRKSHIQKPASRGRPTDTSRLWVFPPVQPLQKSVPGAKQIFPLTTRKKPFFASQQVDVLSWRLRDCWQPR